MSWRDTAAYDRWRKRVLKRDGHKCIITGMTTHLHAHHLNHSKYYPEQRYHTANGVTIHRSIHSIFHNKFMRSYQRKCTREDWERFVRLVRHLRRVSGIFSV